MVLLVRIQLAKGARPDPARTKCNPIKHNYGFFVPSLPNQREKAPPALQHCPRDGQDLQQHVPSLRRERAAFTSSASHGNPCADSFTARAACA